MRDLYDSIRNLYRKFFDNLIRQRVKIKKKSVILTITSSGSNIQSKISKILEESAFESYLFKRDELRRLLDEKLVRTSVYDFKSYVLTSKAIWFLESERELVSEEKFIDFIESEILINKNAEKKLNDKEKVILFSLLSIRCFDVNSGMDINDSYREDRWLDIFDECRNFLYAKNLIKNIGGFKGKGHEHPVSYVMRRVNKLQNKTRYIYAFTGKKQYYLKTSKTIEKSKEELKYLFDLILNGNRDPYLLKEIVIFCNDLAYNKTKYVKDLSFLTKQYDDLIQSSFRLIMFDN